MTLRRRPFNYDDLNRLTRVDEATQAGGGNSWWMSFDYGRYGNRWVSGASNGVALHAATATAKNQYDESKNQLIKQSNGQNLLERPELIGTNKIIHRDIAMISITPRTVLGSAVALIMFLLVIEILVAVWGGDPVDGDRFVREIRGELPLGSSRSRVEEVLHQREIQFSYDGPSRTLTGLLRKVKGSTILVTRSVQLRFRFDEESTLRLIESKTLYAGP